MVVGFAAIGDQLFERLQAAVGEVLDDVDREDFMAEGPAHTQLVVIDLAVDGQPVAQRRFAVFFGAALLAGRHKQRPFDTVETAVELAQVVEGNARHGQCTQAFPSLSIPEVAQDAKPNAFFGNRPQLLLDLFDGFTQILMGGQLDRV